MYTAEAGLRGRFPPEREHRVPGGKLPGVFLEGGKTNGSRQTGAGKVHAPGEVSLGTRHGASNTPFCTLSNSRLLPRGGLRHGTPYPYPFPARH